MTVYWVLANICASLRSGLMGCLPLYLCIKLVLAMTTTKKWSPQPQQVAGELIGKKEESQI